MTIVLNWLYDSGHTNLLLERAGKSAAFRIKTPDIKMYRPFETWSLSERDIYFEAIQELSDLAGMFSIINSVVKL